MPGLFSPGINTNEIIHTAEYYVADGPACIWGRAYLYSQQR